MSYQKFDYYVGAIFARLLEKFPRKVCLDIPDLIGAEVCEETIRETEYGPEWTNLLRQNGELLDLSEEFDIVNATVSWLIEHGYLIGKASAHGTRGGYAEVTLTLQSLQLLKAVPQSVAMKGSSIGEELVDAMKGSAKQKVADYASEFLSFAFKTGWKMATE